MVIHPALEGERFTEQLAARRGILSPRELGALGAALALQPQLWRPLVHHDAAARWYERLALTDSVEIWLIGWWPGQSTPLHDHGGANGALVVVDGELTETTWDEPVTGGPVRTVHRSGTVRRLGSAHVHSVANAGLRPASSIHAYSPPDLPMREYDPLPLRPVAVAAAAAHAVLLP